VRTKGKDKGCVYLAYHDLVEDETHTVFGHVSNGIDLAQQAKAGQRIRVEPSFRRLNTLGLSLSQAKSIANEAGIALSVEGPDEEDAIVISQEPELSTIVKKTGNIHVSTAERSKVFLLNIYEDEARQTAEYFKTISGLKTRALGRMTVFFAHEDLDMILFTGNDKLAGTLTPENGPEGVVRAGEIGITNMASRQRGAVGIRFTDSEEYGPTGEDFAHTNIVGKVDNTTKLRDLKEGDTIYLLLEEQS
jgi:putative methanogenesis marker protein 3